MKQHVWDSVFVSYFPRMVGLGNCPALVPHTEICTLGASMELLRTIGRGLEEERREAWSSV